MAAHLSQTNYTAAMPLRGAPSGSAITSALALLIWALPGGCRRNPTEVEPPQDRPVVVEDETIDTPAVCAEGCTRLERCIPELASELDGDPAIVADRLASECAGACGTFGDVDSTLALRDCLNLSSCDAYWGCVGTATVRPWLAAVAPVGERTCANLCSQASACAIAKVCEVEDEGEGGGKRPRPGKPNAKADVEAGSEHDEEPLVDPVCAQDQARQDELEERCVLQCEATPQDSRARTELIGCVDHASCHGLLRCIDGWSQTDYSVVDGPTPGINETCDGFCTRAIVCGAEQESVELEPAELEELKQVMTSTYVECAVQCGKDLEIGGEAAKASFERCTAVASCTEFGVCADEV
jgi:hypothetical protein